MLLPGPGLHARQAAFLSQELLQRGIPMWRALGQGFLKENVDLSKEFFPRSSSTEESLCGELWDKDSLRKSLIWVRNPLSGAPPERNPSVGSSGTRIPQLYSISLSLSLSSYIDVQGKREGLSQELLQRGHPLMQPALKMQYCPNNPNVLGSNCATVPINPINPMFYEL